MRAEPIADFNARGSIRTARTSRFCDHQAPKTVMCRERRVRLALIVCFIALCACGSNRSSRGQPPPPSVSRPPAAPAPSVSESSSAPVTARLSEDNSIDCRLIPGQEEQPEPGEPIATVALGEQVNPANAPHPSNPSERLLFRQLYEALVRVDCDGVVRPGLAASWQTDASGRTWIV